MKLTWWFHDKVNGKKDGRVCQLTVWRIILTFRIDYYGISWIFYFARHWHKQNTI